MLLQYCSDLHLEFPDNRDWLASKPLIPRAKILLLGGDIVPFAQFDKHKAYFDLLSSQFHRVYWIPGNHEYYHGDARLKSGSYCEPVRPNIFLCNNTVIEEGDTRLILSTLWTQISPQNEGIIEQRLNDFRMIHYGDRTLEAADVNSLHAENLAFIQGELARPTTRKTVVVTHHVPTWFHFPEVHKGDPVNEAFVVELFPIIQDSNASHWIYGHHHFNQPDFHIGKTTLTTNQLGYVARNEHRGFHPGRTLEV